MTTIEKVIWANAYSTFYNQSKDVDRSCYHAYEAIISLRSRLETITDDTGREAAYKTMAYQAVLEDTNELKEIKKTLSLLNIELENLEIQ